MDHIVKSLWMPKDEEKCLVRFSALNGVRALGTFEVPLGVQSCKYLNKIASCLFNPGPAAETTNTASYSYAFLIL